MAGYGMMTKAFAAWKTLPQRKDIDGNNRASLFERKLYKIAEKCIRKGFDPLFDEYQVFNNNCKYLILRKLKTGRLSCIKENYDSND